MAGFENINARVGGNIISPLPYLAEYSKTNPWYNPLMKGTDIVGGISATLQDMRDREELERKRGLQEREMQLAEKQAVPAMAKDEAMAEYYKASAKAAGTPEGKTLSAKDQIMHDAIMRDPNLTEEQKLYFLQHWELEDGSVYPETLVNETNLYLKDLTGKAVDISTMKTKEQSELINRYLDAKEDAEKGKSGEALSPEAVESNYERSVQYAKDMFESSQAGNILMGNKGVGREAVTHIKSYASATGVRLDLPYEYNAYKRMEKRNPALLNQEKKDYMKKVEASSNRFFRSWDKYGDEWLENFKRPEFFALLEQDDSVDSETMWWMYWVHSGEFAGTAKAKRAVGLMDFLRFGHVLRQKMLLRR